MRTGPPSHLLHTAAQATSRLLARSGLAAHPRIAAGAAAGMVLAAGLIVWLARRRQPGPAELERRRRQALILTGRLTDGLILDARTLGGDEAFGPTPEVLLYSYRLAGVVYNCAQDVSSLAGEIAGVRIDQPVQVRYDPHQPGNSIIVGEDWNGLRREPTGH